MQCPIPGKGRIPNPYFRLFLTAMGVLVVAQTGWAHAFLDHAEPAVGSTVHGSPTAVRIWFTEKLELRFANSRLSMSPGGKLITETRASGVGDPALLTVRFSLQQEF
jgi:methionine-rich copper-binding protein CopC